MTTTMREPDHIAALFEPLPELDGERFTRSVMARTIRMQRRSRIIHLVTYVCVATVCAAALPWSSLITELSNVSNAIASPSEPLVQINLLTEWLQSTLSFQNIHAQQIVMIAAAAGFLGSVISFIVTEA